MGMEFCNKTNIVEMLIIWYNLNGIFHNYKFMANESDKNIIEGEQSVEPAAVKVTKPEKATPVSELLKDFKGKLAPEQEAALTEVLSQSEHPDEDPKVLEKAIGLLEGWGFRRIDNDRRTIVAETKPDKQAAEINELVTQGKMPTINYKSNVGLYGFKVKPVEGGILYMKPLAVVNRIENRLRVSGDRGGRVLDFFRKGVRRRANLKEVKANINELGLDNYFTMTEEGIIETTRDISNGLMLTDLFGEPKNPEDKAFLSQFDSKEAVKAAAGMVAKVHTESKRGIGELLTNDVIFNVQEGKMENPRLSLPDLKYHQGIDALEQQATDILDFVFSVGSACHKEGGELNIEEVRAHIKAILKGYDMQNTDMVKLAVKNLAKQGRPHLTMHNGIRLGFDRVKNKKEAFEQVRTILLDELEGKKE